MEDGEKPVSKPRQPSKLDEHPIIPLDDFEGKMREIMSVTPEELLRRETEYQRQQAEKAKSGRISLRVCFPNRFCEKRIFSQNSEALQASERFWRC